MTEPTFVFPRWIIHDYYRAFADSFDNRLIRDMFSPAQRYSLKLRYWTATHP